MGVKECGSKPNRFVEPMNRISDISMRDHFCPVWLWIVIICLDVRWSSHCWMAIRRLVTSRLGDGNRMLGNRIIRVTMGRPIIVGVMKEENRFSFIWFLMGFGVLLL